MVTSYLLLLGFAASKLVSTTITIDEDTPWTYISKFAMDKGTGKWSIRARFQKALDNSSRKFVKLTSSIYRDDRWESALEGITCPDKLHSSSRSLHLSIPENGEWSEEETTIIHNKNRIYFWFFSLSDCDKQLKSKQRIKIELTMINSDGSHFSSENRGLIQMYPIVLGVFLAALSTNLVKLVRKFKKTEDLEPTLLVLNIAIGCQFLGLCFEIIHLWIYSYNGKGINALDFFHQALGAVSSMLITVLFIIIASGWTLKYKELPDADLYIPVTLLVGLLNLLIVGVGRIINDSYYRFSEYEGFPGYIVITIRIALWVWFVYLIKQLYGDGFGKHSMFVLNFGLLASLYLLSQPILLLVSWIFVEYWRNCVVSMGTLLMQSAVFFFLTHLFSDRSSYYKISTMSDSVLPGSYKY